MSISLFHAGIMSVNPSPKRPRLYLLTHTDYHEHSNISMFLWRIIYKENSTCRIIVAVNRAEEATETKVNSWVPRAGAGMEYVNRRLLDFLLRQMKLFGN